MREQTRLTTFDVRVTPIVLSFVIGGSAFALGFLIRGHSTFEKRSGETISHDFGQIGQVLLSERWQLLGKVKSLSVWQDASASILAVTSGKDLITIISDVENAKSIDVFVEKKRFLTTDWSGLLTMGSVIYHATADGSKTWHIVDRDGDGVPELRIIPGTSNEEIVESKWIERRR